MNLTYLGKAKIHKKALTALAQQVCWSNKCPLPKPAVWKNGC